MRRVLLIVIGLVASLLLLEHTEVARAQAFATSSPEARRRASQLTEQAEADYRAQRFEAAAVGYQRAYAVVQEPDLLFNIGQCQRLLERPARALHFFRAYVRLRPDAPQRALVEELIAESERKLAAPSLSPRDAARSTADASRPPLRAYHDSEIRDEESHPLYEQWWFWTGVGVLTLGATAALVVALDEPSQDPPHASLGSVRWE